MNRKVLVSLITILLTCFVLSVHVEAIERTALVVGQSRIMSFREVTRVAVGDEAIADVLVLSPSEVLLNAKQVGVTSFHVWTTKEQMQFQLRVYADDGTLVNELARQIGEPKVNVSFIGENLVVSGVVPSEDARKRVISLASAYSPAVIDILEVEKPSIVNEALAVEIEELIPSEITVSVINDFIVLEGLVEEPLAKTKSLEIAKSFARPVIDLIQIVEPERSEPSVEEPELVTLDELDQAERIRQILDPHITVNHWGDSIFLEGQVKSELDKERAVAVAKAFGLPVVDLITVKRVEPDEAALEEVKESGIRDEQRLFGGILEGSGIRVTALYDHLVLEGKVEDEWLKERALRLSEAFSYPVIDLILVAKPQLDDEKPKEKENDNDAQANSKVDPEEVQRAIDNANIKTYVLGDRLFLEGMVTDEFHKTRAIAIASAFSDNVVDLLRVAVVRTSEEKEESSENAQDDPSKKAEPPKQTATTEDLADDAAQAPSSESEVAQFQTELIKDLSIALKEPGIRSSFIKETLVLEGEVATNTAKERAESIASLFYQPTKSFLEVKSTPELTPGQMLQKHLAPESITVTEVGSNLILEGKVKDQTVHSRVLQIAKLYGSVTDLIEVESSAQVLLKVYVLEIENTVSDMLGIDWGSLIGGVFTQGIVNFREVGDGILARANPIMAKVEALIESGDARLLASPSLLTLSGQEASFLAGGEIPIVMMTPEGPAIEWRSYGIQLNVMPVVHGDQVEVNVLPEVSSLDWTNAVEIENVTYPAMRTRRASTRVRVNDGATLVLGGLILHEESTQIRKLPILGDLPIIGTLFRSKKYQEKKTELVILITPQIVFQEGVDLDGR